MTQEDVGPVEEPRPSPAAWVDDTQEALNRTIDALQVAWGATRDTRLAALNSAKRTVAELTEAVEEGIAAANARWAATQTGESAPEPPPEAAPDPPEAAET
jgi:hypothetical protein